MVDAVFMGSPGSSIVCRGGKVRFIDFPDIVVFVAAEAEARSLRTDNSTSCRRGSWAGGVSLRFGTWLGAGPAVAAVCVGFSLVFPLEFGLIFDSFVFRRRRR